MPKKESAIKILIIEDDNFLAGMYAEKFQREEWEVLIASEGASGLKLAKKELPNVILLDILLPKKDGFVVLEELKAEKKTKEIPVLLLTNLGQKNDVERGLAAGAAGYLIKAHFMPSEVIEKVKQLVK